MTGIDVYAAVIVPIALSAWPSDATWRPGPLPVDLPPAPDNSWSAAPAVADGAARESIVGSRGGALLYAAEVRAHRSTLGLPEPALASCQAGELLLLDVLDGTVEALLVLHCQACTDDPITWTNSLIGAARRIKGEDLQIVGLKGNVQPRGRIRQVVHILVDEDECLQSWYPLEPRAWAGESRAMFYLASAGLPGIYVPDDLSTEGSAGRVVLSSDWGGLVLRDGMAFVPRTSTRASSYHLTARAHVASVYLDAFLLAVIQLHAATLLAEGVSKVLTKGADASTALVLEESLLQFRSRTWWSHLGDRETRVNHILRAAQAQHRIPELIDEITRELQDVARFVESQERRRRETVTWLIAVLSAVFLVPSLVFTAGSSWANPSPEQFWALLTISVVLVCLVVPAISIGLRHLSRK